MPRPSTTTEKPWPSKPSGVGWWLCQLAAYTHAALDRDTSSAPAADAVKALRDLQDEHRQSPPTAEDALVQALDLLESQGGLQDWLSWRRGAGTGSAGHWPVQDRISTTEDVS